MSRSGSFTRKNTNVHIAAEVIAEATEASDDDDDLKTEFMDNDGDKSEIGAGRESILTSKLKGSKLKVETKRELTRNRSESPTPSPTMVDKRKRKLNDSALSSKFSTLKLAKMNTSSRLDKKFHA